MIVGPVNYMNRARVEKSKITAKKKKKWKRENSKRTQDNSYPNKHLMSYSDEIGDSNIVAFSLA